MLTCTILKTLVVCIILGLIFFPFLLSVLLNQSKEVIALLGISIHLDVSALRTVHRGKGFYVKKESKHYDRSCFEVCCYFWPTYIWKWACLYLQLFQFRLHGCERFSPPSSFFFFFPFNFTSFILCSKQANATDGERTLSGSWNGLLCSLISMHSWVDFFIYCYAMCWE